MELLVFYIISSWVLLAALMWADWYESKKPPNFFAVIFFLVYILFMPAFWLYRIGRN
jgi:type IV secretory pathway TrbL component